ncbi:uncharacterized protein LOC125647955 [Ostrea edulis]|uniref:uncharacterized protein LOC125647955 n=1 Tax=Ostrea edulis TaxID=37623 RepID=UPI002094F5A6|nr:uncharacterized protein LOC125647955 [Ostrea edulis]
MEFFKNPFFLFLCLECAALLILIICVLLQIVSGTTYSDEDVAFITVVLVVGLLIVICTICVKPAIRNDINLQEQRLVEETAITRKLKPVHGLLESDCSICLMTKQCATLVQLSCSHVYHEHCVRHWFAVSGDFRCPECREACLDRPVLARILQTLSPLWKSKERKNVFPSMEIVQI